MRTKLRGLLPQGTFSISTTSPVIENVLSPWTGGMGVRLEAVGAEAVVPGLGPPGKEEGECRQADRSEGCWSQNRVQASLLCRGEHGHTRRLRPPPPPRCHPHWPASPPSAACGWRNSAPLPAPGRPGSGWPPGQHCGGPPQTGGTSGQARAPCGPAGHHWPLRAEGRAGEGLPLKTHLKRKPGRKKQEERGSEGVSPGQAHAAQNPGEGKYAAFVELLTGHIS